MTKIQARGIEIVDAGLGISLRVNGVIATPAPVITLNVNGGFKTVVATEDSLVVHPTGNYTDVHYTLAEKLFGVDIVKATGITNEPLFADVRVAKRFNPAGSNSSKDHSYPYVMVTGTDGTYVGYRALSIGSIIPTREDNRKVFEMFCAVLDGSMVVSFGDNGGERPAKAITVKIEGLVTPIEPAFDEELFDIRLEWSEFNDRYELAAGAETLKIAEYLTNVEGASVGLGIVYHH